MWKHYLKIAFRNLLKYKWQNLISVIGLGIGFACFALATLWIRYEAGFDNFHPHGDRIYWLQEERDGKSNTFSMYDVRIADFFRKNFPEVEAATVVNFKFIPLDEEPDILFWKWREIICTDSFFFKVFAYPFENLSLIEMTAHAKWPLIVTEQTARELFGPVDSIGNSYKKHQVVGKMKDWPRNSVMRSAGVSVMERDTIGYRNVWYKPGGIYLLLGRNVDRKAFEKKIKNIRLNDYVEEISNFKIIPIDEVRYRNPKHQAELSFDHLRIFALVSFLVIFCALFNYVTLFISRLRVRSRELAMRKSNGSSDFQLFILLSTEFLIILLFAIFLGQCIIELCMPKFLHLSGIDISSGWLYIQILIYACFIIFISLVAGLFPVAYYRRKSLQEYIHPQGQGGIRNLFDKITLIIQLFISVGLFFCSWVMYNQIHYMSDTGSGLSGKNIWSFSYDNDKEHFEIYKNRIPLIPGVTETLQESFTLFPGQGYSTHTLEVFANGETRKITFNNIVLEAGAFEFYGVRLLKGEFYKPDEPGVVIINESMLKELGDITMDEAIGMTLGGDSEGRGRIIGIVANFYMSNQTTEQVPLTISESTWPKQKLTFKIEKGKENAVKETIYKIQEGLGVDRSEVQFESMDERLKDIYYREQNLLHLLGILTGVCILISMFGIYSLTSLTCQRKRKEIAIRKVHGASFIDILMSFFRENLLLLLIASIIAFPVSYALMRIWLQQFARQADIMIWLFPAIVFCVSIVILLTIYSLVRQATRENPAEVIKEN